MARATSSSYRARRLERERERRTRQDTARSTEAATQPARSADGPVSTKAARATTVSCAWCGGLLTPRSRGPIPKWCSATCRHRAWEQARAAASGRSAVEVVERRVEVPTPMAPTRRDWGPLLVELARQLEDGRVYARDLAALGTALGAVLDAYHRRQPY